LPIRQAKRRGLFGKLTDKSIIEGIRLQDEKVLNYLYDNYRQMVKNHVLQNCGSAEDVADVFQDSIIALYENLSDKEFQVNSDLKGYFFGIAKNTWSVQLRKKMRISELDQDYPEEDDSEEFSDPAFEKILSRSFLKLKPDAQRVLSLFYEGLSYGEIAVKMNLKNETYARRKKYLSKEALIDIVKEDPEYKEYQRFLR